MSKSLKNFITIDVGLLVPSRAPSRYEVGSAESASMDDGSDVLLRCEM